MLIDIRVLPRSSRNEVLIRNGKLTIAVTSPPEAGKATAAAIEAIAKWLHIGSSRLALVSGKSSRNKRISIPDDLEVRFHQQLLELRDRLGK
ncbi:MAG: DUF167 domain-containing protein [Actinomycetota bacterium]|nr:MAG: DUF167 domain-containing protein [Actinomycetota bacterium]